MSRRSLFWPLIFALAFVAVTSSARAEILAEEFFSHSDGNLAGQTPIPGPGSDWIGTMTLAASQSKSPTGRRC